MTSTLLNQPCLNCQQPIRAILTRDDGHRQSICECGALTDVDSSGYLRVRQVSRFIEVHYFQAIDKTMVITTRIDASGLEINHLGSLPGWVPLERARNLLPFL